MEKINTFFSNVIKSLNNLNEGFSLKKEMAVVSLFFGFLSPIVMWSIYAFQKKDFGQLPSVLTITVGFITALVITNTVANNNNKDGNSDGDTKKTS